MRIAASLFVFLLGLTGSVPAQEQGQVELKYQYTPGQTLYYELKQTLTSSTRLPDQPVQENTISQQLQLGTRVNEVKADGSAEVSKRIYRIRMQASQPGMEIPLEYDSHTESELPGPFRMIADSLAKLVNQDLTMTINAQGEASEIQLPESLQKQIEGKEGGVAGMNSTEGVKKMLSQGIVFPSQAVSLNEKWTRELVTDLPFGKMVSQIELTYSGTTKDGQHRIDAVSKISLAPKPGIPFEVTVKDADGRGVYLFDAKRGCVTASALKQVMNLEISAAGQTVQQNVTTDVTMKLVEPTVRASVDSLQFSQLQSQLQSR